MAKSFSPQQTRSVRGGERRSVAEKRDCGANKADKAPSHNIEMMPGRNDPCWCGSGRKFKRCHLDRDRLAHPSIQEISEGQRGAAGLRVCLAEHLGPEPCRGKIVQAHSLSRKASLERISRKQHVYGFQGSFTDLRRSAGTILPKLIGVREASTFTGFCEGHDGRLFKTIDVDPLVPTRQQIGLLSYRALCREIMGKMVLARTIPNMRELDRGRAVPDQLRVQATADEFSAHVSQALPDLWGEQKEWQKVMVENAYARVSYTLIRLGAMPDIVCSGVSQPDRDFRGGVLSDLRKPGTRQDDVAFALVPAETGGFAFFAWLGHFAEAEEFVASLLRLPEERIPNQLVRYAFETFDNVWLSPDWWENLPTPERDFLIERMNTGGLPYAGTSDPYDLRDNGMRFVNWNTTDVQTVFN